ncbi:hypothetical protein BDA96_07G058300 [Sorghum bicolor]|uniref:Uncharacterized protein n=2 Tax=Sorghum bicolor TaxID=4558 RepID=A0A921QIR4_SORBI|nr:(E)-beta-farnesene synthase [Sorghum bicolor]KAG0522678.1 hypothetical protein BDA96_07G058300 [Sorghum bicolor]KXG24531.1 hypothetical protein SORBI_3007G055600 [Sorghum bicolor]|eukprot:XP_021320232.1 (E)-beta-farnesene synthase [Sorghum bicolor]
MSLTPAVCSVNDVQGLQKDLTTYHPSLWGNFFLKYKPPTAPKRGYMTERAEVLKEEVRKMLKAANEVKNILELIITLQRLGLDNHYENEINGLLSFVYNSGYDDKDLNLVSLRFYLLRKHGYYVSSDVFTSFKDKEGNFVADDTKCLLSLYNAAYLRTHGEKVLDEAIIFTRHQLEALLDSLESTLADEVSVTLQTPLFRRVRILETRNYIPIYEKEAARNEVILEFAKLNFNLLQLIYCEELKKVTLWWKQLNVETNLSFIRDRIVECHFWMTGACFEPQYSLARVISTKMTACITILDDIMDTYSTTEEAMLLAEAIYRWEENAAELLPEYMKDFYLYLLKTIDSCDNELGPNKSFRTFYLKEVLKVLVRGNSQEIKWRNENYVPETINEHLEHSGRSVGAFQVACSSFVGMGDNITKEILEWFLTYPELLKSFTTIARLSNDIASTKREQNVGHHVSTVQCYMLKHGTTMDDAYEKIKELIEDTWKDMMELYLTPTEQPKLVTQTVVDFARTADYMYKKTDAFTFSHTLKDMIAKLFVEPILLF